MSTAAAGPFRSWVHFAATGTPTESRTLDDGSWAACSARLLPSRPPPRRLPSTATWAGPRQVDPALAAAPSPSTARRPSSSPSPVSLVGFSAPLASQAASSSSHPDRPERPTEPRKKGGKQRGGFAEESAEPSVRAQLAQMLVHMEALQKQNVLMMQELGQLRRENAELRRKLQAANPADMLLAVAPTSSSPSSSSGFVGDSNKRPGTPPDGRPAELLMDSPAKIIERDAKRAHPSPQPPSPDG